MPQLAREGAPIAFPIRIRNPCGSGRSVEPADEFPSFVFVGTHLCHQSGASRTEQAHLINSLFPAEYGSPIILAGDLNAGPGGEPMQVLLEDRWHDAIAPKSRIDDVLYRQSYPWQVAEVKVVDDRMASDHQPVLAVLARTRAE
ncbi:MAG: endonuclease/exonuclease/phosphatase family protein [Aeoliella sp.]